MEFDVSRFIELINQGRIPGLPEDFAHLQDIALFPSEEIRWVGEVSTDSSVFGPAVGGKYGAIEVLLGVSAYRIALFVETGIIKSKYHFRSFWYKVDFGEEVWERGKFRKTTFTGLMMKPPRLKKGLMSREIEIKNSSTLDSGKQKNTFEGVLSSIKWRDPQRRKFVGGKADLVHAALMEGYKKRIPVSLGELLLLLTKPELLEKAESAPEMAEGRALRVEEDEPLVAEDIQTNPEAPLPPAASAAEDTEQAKASTQKATTKKTSTKKAQVKKTPSKKAPAKKSSVEKVSTEKASAEKSPTMKAPAKKAPTKKASAEKAPAKKAPTKKAPAKKAPAKKTSAGETPAKKTSTGKASLKKTTSKKAPTKKSSAGKAPTKEPSAEKPSARSTPVMKSPADKAPARKVSPKETSVEKAPTKQAVRVSTSSLRCVECGSRLRAQSRFCGKCGTPVEASVTAESAACPNCQADVEAGWVVCPQCGERLPQP